MQRIAHGGRFGACEAGAFINYYVWLFALQVSLGIDRQRRSINLRYAVLKNGPAADLQRLAVAAGLHPLQQALHARDLLLKSIQLPKLAIGQLSPARLRSRRLVKAKEQAPNFLKCKANLSCSLYYSQAVEYRPVVAALPVDPYRRRKNAQPFVIADGRGPQSNLACDFGDA